jgi:hypothetical protein
MLEIKLWGYVWKATHMSEYNKETNRITETYTAMVNVEHDIIGQRNLAIEISEDQ